MLFKQLQYLVDEENYKALLEAVKTFPIDSCTGYLVDRESYIDLLKEVNTFPIDPYKRCQLKENGNYYIIYFDDGTKIRFTKEDSFKPEYPELIDVRITTVCDGGCSYCYWGCNKNGRDMLIGLYTFKLFGTLPPYTEIAINLNDFHIVENPHFDEFLHFLKKKKQFVNVTINQKHLTYKNLRKLVEYKSDGLIKGIGISIDHIDDKILESISMLNNSYHDCCVVHLVAGICTRELFQWLMSYKERNKLNILILGFKRIGNGKEYYHEKFDEIQHNIRYLMHELMIMYKRNIIQFKSISFDNLAIEQLELKTWIDPDDFERNYSGDEGSYSFYMDMVKKKFAISSIEEKKYDMYKFDSIKGMFQSLQKEGE